MKLAFLVILVTCMHVSAAVFGQLNSISLKANDVHLSKVLKLIERKISYRFVYSSENIPVNKKISINVTGATLDEVMASLLADTDLSYKMLSKNLVVIAPRHNAVQNIHVRGRVTDSTGIGLPGVTVKVSNTNHGTITNPNGDFELDAPGDASLEFNYLGYLPQTVAINNRNEITVKLVADQKGLNEVVVVGFGAQKKVNLTGAVATVTPGVLNNRPVASVQDALQGITPGLTVLARPGDVGSSESNSTMTIRGRSNLGSSGPMIVIDGIPVSGREFAALQPNDIESMSVLKDAASAAIYGSRAANGVILVTTKKGKEGKTSIDLNASYGVQSPTRRFEYLGSADYATLYNEALTNANRAKRYTDEEIQKFKNGSQPDLYPNTDWYKEALAKNPAMKDVDLAISGGSKTNQYYLGLGYLGQESLVPNKYMNRYTMRLNASTQVLKILNVGTNVSIVRQDRDTEGGELNWVALNRLVPSMVGVHSDGTWGTINAGKADATLAKDNVLRNMAEGGRGYARDNVFQAGLTGVLKPMKGLTINGQGSLKYNNNMNWSFTNELPALVNFMTKETMPSTIVTPNEMIERWNKRTETLLQAYAEYEKRIRKHNFKVMVGSSQERSTYRYVGVGRRNFPNNSATIIDLGDSESTSTEYDAFYDANVPLNRSYETYWAMLSYFGRINYSFADKYLFEVNYRTDYSSYFAEQYRSANFPSFSVGWRISEEPFMKDIKNIDNLKLRLSVGNLGNQNNVPEGNYRDLIAYGTVYSFNNTAVAGAYQMNGANMKATWETVNIKNVGIDGTFFKGLLDVTADYFIKTTKDILLPTRVGDTYGLKPPTVNSGRVENRGIEIMLSHNNRIGKDFSYNVSVNFSKIKNKILDLGDVTERYNDRWIERVGQPIGSFFGYEAIGLFTTDEEVAKSATQSSSTKAGDIKYKDQDDNGIIDGNDRVIIGNDVPWCNYGFSIGANYKGFDIGMAAYGVTGVKTYLDNEASFSFFNGAGVKPLHLERWTKENPNPNAKYPRLLLSADGKQNYNSYNSFWLFDASYLRIRTITAGYTVPAKYSQKVGMSFARVYVAANNPFTFMFDDRLTDYDPEIPSGRGGYPGIKTWSVGVNVKF
ncbi:TonB-dependent receptor [Chitinophaga skermanii]|nr:TonB-dependent receptor [Chitinophaga skermanii]